MATLNDVLRRVTNTERGLQSVRLRMVYVVAWDPLTNTNSVYVDGDPTVQIDNVPHLGVAPPWTSYNAWALQNGSDLLLIGSTTDVPLGLPLTRVYNSATTINIATGGVVVPWNITASDDRGWHDTVTNNTRITPDIPGVYNFQCTLQWDANTTGRRGFGFRKNGTNITYGPIGMANTAAANTHSNGSLQGMRMNGTTDYMEVFAFQDSGTTRTIGASDEYSSFFSCQLGRELSYALNF
jgi:hypothetical protein